MQALEAQHRNPAAVLEAFLSMTRKQLIIMTRYPVNFFVSFAEILTIIVLFTFAVLMFSPSGVEFGSEGALIGMMFGMIPYMFLNDTLWMIGDSIRWEQYQGTLESLYLTPASKFANLVSRVAVSLVWTGLNLIAVFVFVNSVLWRLPFHNVGLAAFLLIMTLAGTFGLGFVFAAFTLLAKESANMTANFLQFALMGLCAMFFPFSTLPPIVRAVSRLIPLSYCVDALRSALMGYPPGFPELLPAGVELIIVTLFGLLMPPLGYAAYRAVERKARRDGSLAEF